MQKIIGLLSTFALGFGMQQSIMAQVLEDTAPLTLSTPELSIRLAPQRAWTIDSINFAGKPLAKANSNYGFIIDLGGNKFVGSGHTEGGKEQVLDLRIEADGKPIDFSKGGQINGNSFVVIKKSKLAFLNLETTFRLKGNTLEEQHQAVAFEEGRVSKIYGFMYAWVPTTSEWLAQTAGGKEIEGVFDNTGWEMREDVRWASLFDPASNTAILTEFPDDLPASAGIKHAYWDLAAYHKQYFQPVGAREFKVGDKINYSVKVKALPAEAATWKNLVRESFKDKPKVAKSPVQEAIEKRFPAINAGDKPDWLKNPVAMEALDPSTVLKPWTPVKATATKVDVWNRTYSVGNWGLPEQVNIGGRAFLSAPAAFDLKLEGATTAFSAAPHLQESFAGVARYNAQSTKNGVQMTANTAYEYDGFVRTDIEVKAPAGTRAQEWELVIPFKGENAQFYSAIHASSMKMESQQRNSISAAIPAGEGEVWKSDFRPMVWIGNRDAGLCWFSESREHWSPEVNPRAIRIVRNKGQVELRISFIAEASPLPRQMKLSFGLMATPVRPRPEGWRGWKFLAHQSVSGHTKTGAEAEKLKPKMNHAVFWHDSWRITLMYPRERDSQAFRNEVEYLKKNGVERIYPYVVASHITGSEKTHIPGENFVFTAPEWKAFAKEWEIIPNRQPENFRRVSPASSFADYHLSTIKDWVVDAKINGVYVDEAYPYPNTVAEHGMGFTNSKGERVPTYQIYSMRNYFKRMAYLFQKHGDGTPAIMAHASNVLMMPFLSFVDIFVDGEQVYHRIYDWKEDGPPSYMKMTPLDLWGAEYTGRQFGYVPLFLPAMRPNLATKHPNAHKEIAPTREMLALAQLHDVLVWPLWSNADEWRKVLAVRDEFQIGGEDVKFYPFWETKTAATTTGPNIKEGDVLVSTYTGKQGILAVVVNLTDKEQQVSVDFSKIQYRKNDKLKAFNAQTSVPLALKSDKLSLAVPQKDFVLVRVK